MSDRSTIGVAAFRRIVGEAFPGRLVAVADRTTGSTKKGVYRLTLDDATTLIAYAWSPEENDWPVSEDPEGDPFSDASGADLFTVSHAALVAADVPVPHLYAMDRTRRHCAADIALVEDLRGETLEALIERDLRAAGLPLHRLGVALRRMQAHRGDRYGKLARIEAVSGEQSLPAEDVVLARAERHLAAITRRDPRVAAVGLRADDLLRAKHALIEPRREYGLVHGELGPDHVFLNDDHQPVLIDIEGLTFFDVEWEHAFLRLRFPPQAYAGLTVSAA